MSLEQELEVDGIFGPVTTSFTRSWQRKFGLEETGEVSTDEYNMLSSLLVISNFTGKAAWANGGL